MQPGSVPQLVQFDLGGLPLDLVLWLVFAAVVLIFGVYSAILLWHWNEYSTGKFTTVANMFVYLGVSAGLLVIMALSVFWYSIA